MLTKEYLTMRYAIIENEEFALQHLKMMVSNLRPDYTLAFTAESVEECVEYFGLQPSLDLIFMDIELTDANCFTIFEHVNITVPIIFTTAYDEYAIRAFKVNSVDYLLKPICEEELLRAIEKFETHHQNNITNYASLLPNHEVVRNRKRILITLGDRYYYINIADVAYFIREDKYVNAIMNDGKCHITDFQNLTEVIEQVSASDFFLLSRNIIVNIASIANVSKWFSGRLNVVIGSDAWQRSIIVSANRKKDFLKWMGGALQCN